MFRLCTAQNCNNKLFLSTSLDEKILVGFSKEEKGQIPSVDITGVNFLTDGITHVITQDVS